MYISSSFLVFLPTFSTKNKDKTVNCRITLEFELFIYAYGKSVTGPSPLQETIEPD